MVPDDFEGFMHSFKMKRLDIYFTMVLLSAVYGEVYKSEQKFDVVGIYSVCGGQQNISKFNKQAFSVHMGIFYSMHELSLDQHFRYQYFDVCTNQTVLVNLLVDIILDPNWNRIEDGKSNIVFMFLFLSKQMVKLTANLLLTKKIPIISFDDHLLFPDRPNSHPFYLPYGELTKRDTSYYSALFDAFKFQYITLLSLNRSHETHKLYNQLFGALLQNSEVCFIAETIETEIERTDIEKKLQRDKMLQVVLLFGDQNDIKAFLSQLIVLGDKEIASRTFIPIFYVNNADYHNKQTVKLFHFLQRHRHDELVKQFTECYRKINDFDYAYIVFAMMEMLIGLKHDMIDEKIQIHEQNATKVFNSFERYVLFNKDRSINNKELFPHALRHPPITKCSNFSCEAGWEKKIAQQKDGGWRNEYSYICSKCETNFVKSNTGKGKCVKCVGKNVSNDERTLCFLPYKNKSLSLHQIGNMLSIILNSIGVSLSMIALVVFAKNRTTPIVRASDAVLSFIQLASILITFCVIPFMMLSNQTIMVCIAKPLSIGIFINLTTSIVICKSMKILGAFSSSKKLSPRSIHMTTAQQYFFLFMTMFLSLLVALICFQKVPPKIKIHFDVASLTNVSKCNTDDHLHVQLAYLFLLLFVCLIQAFRSRNVPKNFGEAMNIVYAAFTCCIFLIILIPLHRSQTDVSSKIRVHWIILLSINLVLLLALYGHKVFVMLFHPKLNSRESFRKSTMITIQNDVESKSKKRQRSQKSVNELEVMLHK